MEGEPRQKDLFPDDGPKEELKQGTPEHKGVLLNMPNHDDGLDSVCDACGDRPGGCPQCGYGRKQAKASRR